MYADGSAEAGPVEAAVIPVTVVGGYLGAGKTTLVNHILATALERVAVLVNDFGEVDIDRELIESRDGDTISLANGCVCCSLVDGLAGALATVQAFEPPPQRLVIEASGVADPASVAAYGHAPGLILDAVIVLVDAVTVRDRSTDRFVGDTIRSQLRSADVLILNKVDLVGESDAAATVAWLSEQAPEAAIVEAREARVAPEVLFGVSSGRAQFTGERPGHRHAADVFESWSWVGDAVERAALERVMAELPDEAMRAKGVVRLSDDPDQVLILQRVGRRWTLQRRATHREPQPGSRLVVIGYRGAIDETWLSDRLDQPGPGPATDWS